ncbi:MAG TPA: N-acetylglucosamine-6-phosphate deacetylase [Candidatus Limnocylindria bacterium]
MPDAPILYTGLASLGDLTGPSAVLIGAGRILALDADAEVAASTATVLRADGLTAAPGFIELQLNGIDGHDFTSDPASIWTIGAILARHGVTAFLPTIVTSPRGTVESALDAWRRGAATDGQPVPLGLHVEGPYLAAARAGAHDRSLLRPPEPDEIAGWIARGGPRIVTLAPEVPGALGAIAQLTASGVVVSIGHTDADAATTRQAIDAGARYATHLFNAMSPLGHHAPGAPGALLDDPRVTLGLILDGHHLDPVVTSLVARLAPGRISLVSDAIAALGLPDGTHRLGAMEVVVREGAARLADGTLAGSVTGLDACVRELARVTRSAAAAVEAVTATPARLLGDADRGHLRPGARADLVLLDADLVVRRTIVAGRTAFEA